MKKNNITLVDSSRQFDIDELFFSTTNSKGIITSCNEVFVRVSAFQATELLGKPHNIVRHPDMPRCVFQLLWDYLLSGRQIGAYVKNLARTGEYYWVFALACPIEQGFLSVRLKPSSPFLEKVEGLYAKLLEIEAASGDDWRAGMENASKQLIADLKDLGFDSYDDFMGEALRVEMNARKSSVVDHSPVVNSNVQNLADKQRFVTGEKLDTLFEVINELVTLRATLNSKERFVQTMVNGLNLISLNSEVSAAHLGASGEALGIIGQEIARSSRTIKEQSEGLTKDIADLASALKDSTFYISLASLQSQMSRNFWLEKENSQLSIDEQITHYGQPLSELIHQLDQCCYKSYHNSEKGLEELLNSLSHFEAFVSFLSKFLQTLQFAYVTGKTEAARVEKGEKFSSLLEDLLALSSNAYKELNSLAGTVSSTRQIVSAAR